MSKTSFREPFVFPYVTASVPRWAPTPLSETKGEEYLLKPGEDANSVFASYDVVKLEKGGTYYWREVDINKPLTLYGNGATVRCSSPAYALKVTSPGVKIFDCIFVGKRPTKPGEDTSVPNRDGSFGLLLHNTGCVVRECAFYDFQGSALCVYDDDVSSGNYIVRCYFRFCKVAVLLVSSVDQRIDGGLIDFCRFENCQYGVYGVSMPGWRIADCLFVRCASGVFHLNKDRMSYGDAATGGNLEGFVLVNGCIFKRGQESDWSYQASTTQANQTVSLCAFYFDDNASFPPRLCNSLFADSGVCVGDTLNGIRNVIMGCVFWYDTQASNASKFNVFTALNGGATSAYFLGCAGRNGCKASGGLKANNFDNSSFVTGLVTTRTIQQTRTCVKRPANEG